MRICKEYLPNKLSLLQEEYEKETSKKGIRSDSSSFSGFRTNNKTKKRI